MTRNFLSFAISSTSVFFASIGVLLYMSNLITGGSWEFLSSTYGAHLLLPDLTPNVGLWWYFFIEMFDSFREFFLGVFWLHLGAYVGGLCFRLRKQPLFIIATMLGIFAVFKPYPSISDTSLYLAILPLYRHIFPCEFDVRINSCLSLTQSSDALHLRRRCDSLVRYPPWAGFLLSMDLCWLGECQFFLRHYPCMESGIVGHRR